MNIIPSIDLLNDRCVRLKQGDYQQVSIYHDCPVEMAKSFRNAGAKILHVVDLFGSKEGLMTSISTISKIVDAFQGAVQVGGGIRTTNDLDTLFSMGVSRAVIGTGALSTQMDTWLNIYDPSQLLLALDFKLINNLPLVSITGWTQTTQFSVWDLIKHFPSIQQVLCTDIGRDGMQIGPNHSFYQDFMQRYPHIQLQASGGIGTIEDLTQLASIGVSGAVIGKALYEGNLSLSEALLCLK